MSSTSRRTPWIVTGIVLMVIAAPVVAAGIVLLALFGTGGDLRTGPHTVTAPGRALVSSVAQIEDTADVREVLGTTRLEIEGTARTADRGVFLGVAPAAAVDRYLAGAEIDVVRDFDLDPFTLTTDRRAGTAVVGAPGEQDFWVASAESQSGAAKLSWATTDGDYRVVMMNADGSASIDVDSRFGVVVPQAFGLSLAVLLTGLVIGLAGAALLLAGLLRRSAPPAPPAAPPVAQHRSPGPGTVPAQAVQDGTSAPDRVTS